MVKKVLKKFDANDESVAELPGDHNADKYKIPASLPLLPVRDVVLFPYMILPLYVSRQSSIDAINEAILKNKMLMLVTQKDPDTEQPLIDDLYSIGSVSLIIKMVSLPDGRVKILVQGLTKAKLLSITTKGSCRYAKIQKLFKRGHDQEIGPDQKIQLEALASIVRDQLEMIIELGKHLPPDIMVIARNIDEAGKLADLVSSNIGLTVDEAQAILAMTNPIDRLAKVSEHLMHEIELLKVKQKIQATTHDELSKTQKEYFLREQLKVIQKELGYADDKADEVAHFQDLIVSANMPEAAKQESLKQIDRLTKMHSESAEATIIRTYLEWMTELPWSTFTAENLDLNKAQLILDQDHYGLGKIKERFIEYIAVRKLKKKIKGSILCLVGPPGVGKTSLGQSVARALNRNFVRISLGGVRDEAEIRGHRRTYIGAMPGKIILAMKQSKSNNPLIMLDEIDKLGSDFRGDPSSALLEALDPAQNMEFVDHYIGLPFDLSDVMFVTTANVIENISAPLLDRMEIIRLAGYTENQKVCIAQKHIMPRLLEEHGLKSKGIHLSDEAIGEVIQGYTREAGLRMLEKNIASILRKKAKLIALNKKVPKLVAPKNLPKILGARQFFNEAELERNFIGVATGVAWTAVGGEIMNIEAVLMKGVGKIILTGKLGDVMKESAQAALTYIRSRTVALKIDEDFINHHDIHIHVPLGSISKDGPSAGITIATAMLSAITNRPTRKDIAMTGEITLRGALLPIGGLKEKALGAIRANIKELIIPDDNRRDLLEMPASIKEKIKFIPIKRVEQAFKKGLISYKANSPDELLLNSSLNYRGCKVPLASMPANKK